MRDQPMKFEDLRFQTAQMLNQKKNKQTLTNRARGPYWGILAPGPISQYYQYYRGPILPISIITQVIIEILALSLAENGVIFRYNHLRRGDYSGRTNFQNREVKFDVYGKRQTANGKRQTFAVCLQLSVQQNQNICICSE